MMQEPDNQIAVVYHTITGTTERLAQAIAKGIESTGQSHAVMLRIEGADISHGRYINQDNLDIVSQAGGVVFGSPTFMGNVSAQFKAFADASSDLWYEKKWSGKVAGGFTVGSNLSGDQLCTIQYLHILASQHGMIWCGIDIPGNGEPESLNRLGAQSGLIAHSPDGGLNQMDVETAEYLGRRVARLAAALTGSSF